MIFKEWKIVKLGDAIIFNPRESIAKNQLAKKVAMEKLKPFIKYIDSYEVAEFNGGSKFKNGDTIVARITPCLENGKTAQVTIFDENETGFGSTEYIVLREKKGVTNKDFIYYLAISQKFREVAIKSMVGSSGRQRVQQDELEDLEVLLPPIHEQKAIAAILSCIDDKIKLNNRMNENLEEMAQAIFKNWFVDFEPFQDGEFEDSELGRIPQGWRIGTLGEIIKLNYGKGLPANKRVDGKVKVYSSAGITGFHNEALLNEPSIILGRKGSIGTVFFSMEPSYCIDTAYYSSQKDCKFPLLLMYQLLKGLKLEQYNEDSAVPGLNRNTVYALHVIIPPDPILRECNETLRTIYNMIFTNINESKTLEILRDTLLPKLMSGEIRVPLEEVQ